MTCLVLVVMLFLPGWTKEAPDNKQFTISVSNMGEYQTMTDCQEQLAGLKDIVGVYKKTAPFADEYYTTYNLTCVRKDVQQSSPDGAKKEREVDI